MLRTDNSAELARSFVQTVAYQRQRLSNSGVTRKRASFWLQLPHQKFYPDFVAMLHDGRILVVEYKGGHLDEGEGPKRTIGAVWAEASDGKCLFCMPTEHQFSLIDQAVVR